MIEALFKELKENNIAISLDKEDLKIKFNGLRPDSELLQRIKENKGQIVEYLNSLDQHIAQARIHPAGPQSSYPLSSSQYRLWVLSQFSEANVAYNLPWVYVLEGTPDHIALEFAFNQLLLRHEILRTVFQEDEEGNIRQFILPVEETGFGVEYRDLQQLTDHAVKEQVAAFFNTPFNLASGPLMRAGIFQVAGSKCIFVYVMHHIISDGWSLGILMKEFLLLYNKGINREHNPLTPLRIQYKDYAVWQQRQLQGDPAKLQKAYWLNQFSGELPVLQLPADRLRGAVRTYRGGKVTSKAPDGVLRKMKSTAQEQGCTLFMSLLAAVNIVLYRYTDQEDIILGSPIAGRDHLDVEDQIGLYLNTLALRTRFSGTDNYLQLLNRVKQITLEAYEHQDYPFDKLIDELKLTRDLSRNALFDVMIILQNTAVNANRELPAFGNLTVSNYQTVEHVISKFDLTFDFVETGNDLLTRIEYNSDLYDADTIEQLCAHFNELLKSVTSAPLLPLHQLEYMSAAEQRKLLRDFNHTAADYPRSNTITGMFAEQVKRTPEKIALVCGSVELTYRDLQERSDRLGAWLLKNYAIRSDDRVAIQLVRSEWMVISILAVLKAGGAYVPIDPEYPSQRVDYIVSDSDCRLVLDEKLLEQFKLQEADVAKHSQLPVIDPGDLAYVIYTSGSTGLPKGVMIEHRNVVSFFQNYKKHFGLNDTHVLGAGTNYTFDISVLELLGTLVQGIKTFLIADPDPAAVLTAISTGAINALQLTPSRLVQLLETAQDSFSTLGQLKVLLVGGEAMGPSTYQLLKEMNSTKVVNVYGPTETTIWSSSLSLHESETLSIGTPLLNECFFIIDKHSNLCPVGVAGEICIGGEGVARGYWNKPALTAEKFVPNPFRPGERMYRTGDSGKWRRDGTIEFSGRKDDQVKIRGHRIEPGEIETALLAHPAISAAVVVVKEKNNGDKWLMAFLVAANAPETTEIRAFLGHRLPAYMIPKGFVTLEKLPLTPNGKVDRNRLKLLEGNELSSGTPYVAPRTHTEEQLVLIWQELLEREKTGVLDDFFASGGHSLSATRLAAKLYRQFGVKLGLRELFTATILEDQARLVDQAVKIAYQHIPAAPAAAGYPLSSSQHRLWILSQVEERNITYNIPGVFVLQGQINYSALERTFAAILERHEVLRTVFREEAEGVRQIIRPSQDAGFGVVQEDLRYAPDPGMLVKERIEMIFRQPFDLSTGPLLRVHLLQPEENEWVLVYVMHHLISDGWSIQILLKEFILLYNTFSNEQPDPLVPLRIQYKDYALWQQKQLDQPAAREHEAYWLGRLQGELPVLDLPLDKQRPARQTYRGSMVNKVIDARLGAGLKELSQRQGGTLFMGLLAAVNVLLYRYTSQNDLIIGSPIAGREHPDLEDQIGFYINTLALRTRFRGTDSFEELLQTVKQGSLEAYEHQSYPFDELVDRLRLKRDPGRSALFDVMVLLQNYATHQNRQEEQISQQLIVKAFQGGEHVVSKYDLTFYFTETENFIITNIEYNSDLFHRETILQLGNYLERLLAAILAHPGASIDALVAMSLNRAQLPLQNMSVLPGMAACSEHQKRLWFIDQFERNYLYEGSPVYHNLPLILQYRNGPDSNMLHQRFQRALQKYSVLRTRIMVENSVPFQVIDEYREQPLTIHTLAETLEGEALQRTCTEIVNKPFDISNDPLIRFTLLSHPQQQVLIIAAHHLIADRRSLELLAMELLDGNNVEEYMKIAPYTVFSEWQHQLPGEAWEYDNYYWKRKLTGAPVLYLDTDHTREHIHIYEAALQSSALPEGLAEKLEVFCSNFPATPHLVLLTCFQILLHRYTGSEDIVTGTFHQNRTEGLTSRMIGPLANLVTLRNKINAEDSLLTLLQRVSSDHQASVNSGGLPFEKVVLAINPEKDMSRTALFDLLFHYEEVTEQRNFEVVELNHGLGKYDLNVLVKKEEELTVYVTFNQKYFTAGRIERLLTHYQQIIEQAIGHPEQAIHLLDYIPASEKEQLVNGFNDRQVSYPRHQTIISLFEEQAAKTPDNIALVFEQTALSYKELNEKANQLGAYLRQTYRVQPDDLLAIRLPRNEWMVIAMLAVLKSGGAYVPVDTEYPQERIDYIIADSQSKVVIDQEELETFNAKAPDFPTNNLAHINQPDHVAYVIYTSGTTGNPKGTLIEHKSVVRLLITDRPLFDFNEQDRWTMFHSYCFDFSVWEMYGALIFGGRVIIVPSATAKDPAAFLDLLNRERVTILNQTPLAFYNLIESVLENDCSALSLRYVIFGGEALSPGKLAAWKEKYPEVRLINMYGITETTVHVTYKEIGDVEIAKNISNIGVPIPTLSCYVLDKNQQLVPTGVWGELYVGGEGVSRGYLNRETLTAQKFIDSPFIKGERLYRSGDKVKLLENGEMEYGGRIDEQVKIRGYRIELGEIINALRNIQGVEDAVVVARQQDKGEAALVAYFVSREKLPVSSLRQQLALQLPAYMLPAHYVHLHHLPLTSNGKIDRKRLPAPERQEAEGALYTAPRNATEQQLATIWQEILGMERVGIRDNFFESGGHSLSATRLAGQMYKQFGVKVSLKDLFTKPVLEEQALLLDQSSRAAYDQVMPAPAQPHYPLSSSQRRLWILSQFEDGNIAYNIPGFYVIEGGLDYAALEFSFSSLIGRHEILRTVFLENEQGIIRQFIQGPEENGFGIHYEDLRHEPNAEELVKSKVELAFRQPFDLAKGPLLRAGVYQLAENKWIFMYVVHHMISDGWSTEILIKEFFRLYNAAITGEQAPLAPLRIQYKDYAVWQQQQLSTENIDPHKQYWLKQFEGELPVLDLRGSRNRPAVKTYNGASVSKKMDAAIGSGIRSLCNQQGSTLFTGLLTAVNILLFRYTGQHDLITGTPAAGRDHVDFADQIGFYVNTLALRVRISADDTYATLSRRVGETILDAYEHELYPFDELVHELNLQRNVSRNPLFDIQVIVDNNDLQRQKLPRSDKLRIYGYGKAEKLTSVFDMVFHFTQEGDNLYLTIIYNSDIYDHQIASQLALHLEQLLAVIIRMPDQAIDRLDFLPEKDILLKAFNNSEKRFAGPADLVGLFEEQMQRTPDMCAVMYGEKKLSYRQMDQEANKLANYLRETYAVVAEELIGVMTLRSDQYLIAILGILKAGAAFIPIDPAYPEERKRFMIDDTRIRVIVTQMDYIFDLSFFAGNLFAIDAQLPGLQTAVTSPGVMLRPEDLAYVIYTSGSTGQPKGVMIEHRAIVNTIRSQIEIFDVQPGERQLQFASASFDASVSEIFTTLLAGGCLCIIGDEQKNVPQLLEQYITEQQIDLATIPPAYLKLLSIDKIRRLKKLVTAGEAAIPSLAASFSKTGIYLNAYGPTESAICATIFKAASAIAPDVQQIPIGTPIANTRVYILDASNNLAPIGVAGEICIGGAGLARGYLNRPELTAEKFVADPFRPGERIYRTGDLGRWLVNGDIDYLGRIDDQVKVRGFRIEPGEIEHLLSGYPGVDSCAVLVQADQQGGKELVAYLTPKSDIQVPALRAWIGNSLPAYMIPHHFVQMDELPLSGSGKVDKKKLAGMKVSSLSGYSPYAPPRNELEKEICTIWENVLGKESIGIDHDFFESGGDSLKAMMVVKKMMEQTGIELPVKILFELKNIRNIAEQLSARTTVTNELTEAVAPEGPVTDASFNQLNYFSNWQYGGNVSVLVYETPGIEIPALKLAIHALMQRHEPLRTVYEKIDGVVKQKILTIDPAAIDISGPYPVDSDAAWQAIQDLAPLHTFDLFSWPLFFIKLYRKQDKEYVLAVLHHSITDGHSNGILRNELDSLYKGIIENKDPGLPPLPFRYRDYANWQQQFVRSPEGQRHKEYWLQRLEGFTTNIPWPASGNIEETKPQDLCITKIIGDERWDAINLFTQKNGITRSALLLATLFLTLHRHTGENDGTVFVTASGRNSKHYGAMEVNGLIGLFASPLLVRDRLITDGSLLNYLHIVQNNFLDDISHESYHLMQLINELPGIDAAEMLARAAFYNYHNYSYLATTAYQISETEYEEPMKPADQTSIGFGLAIEAFSNCLKLRFFFKGQIFDPMQAQQFKQLYLLSLQQMIQEPQRSIQEILNHTTR